MKEPKHQPERQVKKLKNADDAPRVIVDMQELSLVFCVCESYRERISVLCVSLFLHLSYLYTVFVMIIFCAGDEARK